jgi:signal peptidase I
MLAGAVALVLVASAGLALGAWRFTVIDTGSMRPTLNPGDVTVLTSEPLANLKRGQIIAFHPPGEPSLTVMHRVYSISRSGGGITIQTKGDANNATDPWHARLTGGSIWHEVTKVSTIGRLAAWSQVRVIRFALLLVIVALVVTMLLGSLWEPDALGDGASDEAQ